MRAWLTRTELDSCCQSHCVSGQLLSKWEMEGVESEGQGTENDSFDTDYLSHLGLASKD